MASPHETLSTLHTAVAQELLDRIQSGEAKPADLAVAVKFLKDNNIDTTTSIGLINLSPTFIADLDPK